jgi:hypothetical protein
MPSSLERLTARPRPVARLWHPLQLFILSACVVGCGAEPGVTWPDRLWVSAPTFSAGGTNVVLSARPSGPVEFYGMDSWNGARWFVSPEKMQKGERGTRPAGARREYVASGLSLRVGDRWFELVRADAASQVDSEAEGLVGTWTHVRGDGKQVTLVLSRDRTVAGMGESFVWTAWSHHLVVAVPRTSSLPLLPPRPGSAREHSFQVQVLDSRTAYVGTDLRGRRVEGRLNSPDAGDVSSGPR